MVLRILNLEGYQYCLIGSKVTTILKTFFCTWLIRVFWIWSQFTLDNCGVCRGRSMAIGVSDRWLVTCDIWLITYNSWFFFYKKCQNSHKKCKKCKEMAKKCPKVHTIVKKEGFHSIGATIHTCQEIQCLPYEGFFLLLIIIFIIIFFYFIYTHIYFFITCNSWHLAPDTWQLTPDTWDTGCGEYFLKCLGP